MDTLQNISVEQLAKAFQELTISEKEKLVSLLPSQWFKESGLQLDEEKMQALDYAEEKELRGNAVFESFADVKKYVKHRPIN